MNPKVIIGNNNEKDYDCRNRKWLFKSLHTCSYCCSGLIPLHLVGWFLLLLTWLIEDMENSFT